MSNQSKRRFNLRGLLRRRPVQLVLAVLVVAIILGMVRGGWNRASDKLDPDNSHTATVQRGDLVVSILQSGEIQARKSRDVMNDAYRDAKIIEIVDDGAFVTNGQLLVELESAELKERYLQQKSQTASAESDLEITKLKYVTDLESAELNVELAKLELKKYIEAEAPQDILKAQSDIKLAEQELKKARSRLEGTQELYDKGYSNRQDLESDQLAVDRRDIEVRNKKKDLEILQEYTAVKRQKELQNKVTTAMADLERLKKTHEAQLENKEARLSIERNQLETREKQLNNTKVYSEFEGQVFYPKPWRGRDKIELGATVNMRQTILQFPDMSAWDIHVGVPESMIDRVELGQEAVATVEAIPGLVLKGRVKKIGAVPESQSWFNAAIKNYTVYIEIYSDNIKPLKPGMSTTVEIVTDELNDVYYVPIQAVVTRGAERYVYVVKRGRKALREVETGKYNNDFIEIHSGLEAGEEVLLYAEVEMEADVRMKESPVKKSSAKSETQEKKGDA
jgi:HlyD family secretion protein